MSVEAEMRRNARKESEDFEKEHAVRRSFLFPK